MTRYVVAADGGNSKTDLVVATVDGAVLSRVTGPGTRPAVTGLAVTVADLVALTRAGVAAAGLPPDGRPEVGSYYLANVDFADEEAAMLAALTTAGVAARLEIRNDTLAVLRAGSPSGWGIAVVGGAGINAMGMHPDGRQERFLAIGEHSGDWGGGHALATAALGAAVRAADGRGPATALSARLLARFGAPGRDDIDAIAIAATRGHLGTAELLRFAPDVFAAASDGDAVATGIVHRFADEVLAFVRALVTRLAVADERVDVVLGGGTLQARNPVLMTRLEQGLAEIAPKAVLHVLSVPPVVGPLVGALELAGATPDAIARARASVPTVAAS